MDSINLYGYVLHDGTKLVSQVVQTSTEDQLILYHPFEIVMAQSSYNVIEWMPWAADSIVPIRFDYVVSQIDLSESMKDLYISCLKKQLFARNHAEELQDLVRDACRQTNDDNEAAARFDQMLQDRISESTLMDLESTVLH